MHRRAFVTGLSAAAAFPLKARAGEAGRLPVVGLIFADALANIAGTHAAYPPARAFVHGLRDLGWVEDKTVIIEWQSAQGDPQRAPALLAELIAQGVDVIVLGSALWLHKAAQFATRTIPTVAVFANNPVADGLVGSLARPGGNLTGVTTIVGRDLIAKRLQFLKDLAPGTAKLAFLGIREAWELYRQGIDAAEAAPIFVEVDRPAQYDEAFAALRRAGADAIYVSGGGVNYVHVARIVSFAAENNLPAVYGFRGAVEVGGLISYGAYVSDYWHDMASLADKILKGAKPADLPVQQPTRFELVINQNTADALGLTIPPLLRARADEIIE